MTGAQRASLAQSIRHNPSFPALSGPVYGDSLPAAGSLALGAATALAGCMFAGVAPFNYVPKLPGGAVTATPLIWLTVLAAVLTAAGLAAFRRRDLT